MDNKKIAYKDRIFIEKLHREKCSEEEIAQRTGFSIEDIKKEIEMGLVKVRSMSEENKSHTEYRAFTAQQNYDAHLNGNALNLDKDVELMSEDYSVGLDKIVDNYDLEVMYCPKDTKDISIITSEINRPGIVLTGYTDYFDPLRIQILGWTELEFLQNMPVEERHNALSYWLSLHPAAAIITRGLEVSDYFIDACKEFEVPLLRTDDATSSFIAGLIGFLNRELAPRITRHGVLVEVYGEGILIVGESGAGKSECAIELIKRGHRLIADDAVEIRKVSERTLEGTSPSNIRYFVELRGIGIINARRVFGMGAVKPQEKIDMVVQFEEWDSTKAYDRLGLDNTFTRILDVKVPMMTVPVTPGRNLAVIVETAAMNNRQKKMGYNAAKELMTSLGVEDMEPSDKEMNIWNS